MTEEVNTEELNKDALIALKALLYIRDNPHRLTYGVIDPIEDFARRVIERAEFRPENRNTKFNGVPKGWYDDVKSGSAPHPYALLVAASANHGRAVLSDYGVRPADLEAYFERTALAGERPAGEPSVNPKP